MEKDKLLIVCSVDEKGTKKCKLNEEMKWERDKITGEFRSGNWRVWRGINNCIYLTNELWSSGAKEVIGCYKTEKEAGNNLQKLLKNEPIEVALFGEWLLY